MKHFERYRKPRLTITKGGDRIHGPIRRMLLIQLGDIGDVVLAIPTLRSLKESYPSAHITVAVRDKASELMHLCPWCDDVLPIKKEKLSPVDWAVKHARFFRALRSNTYDLAFDMRTGTRGGILAFLSGARIRLGFTALEDTWRNWLFTHLVYPPMDMPMLHMAHYHLLLLDRYGLTVNPRWPRLHIDPYHAGRVNALLQKEQVPSGLPLIAVQPFSLWRYKEWGEEKFIQLIKRIVSAYRVGILICGSAAERPRIARMMNTLASDPVTNLAGRTTIAEYTALLARCAFFIGCDSAGVHLAAAVQTPTATLYGPTSPDAWAPREAGHMVIRNDMDCVPCRQKGCRNSGSSRCLVRLSVDAVVQRIAPLLSSLTVA